jgi:group II intron reverse transcriptase/maturase
MVLTTLAQHVDAEWLHEAYRETRKDGAVGVDGETAEQYAVGLEERLADLLERFKSGTYKAPPSRRALIPKGDGRMRPIGIPTFEDKVLQRAVGMVLEAVYEQSFLDCSYGFRPGRSAHGALEALWQGLMRLDGGWVLEADIESFFDSVDHGQLRVILDQRVRDGVVRRAIDKWLAAGVLEAEGWKRSELGTPQGGVLSPLLANVYLHEVLDVWFEEVVQPRMRGPTFLIRYADDFVIVFASERDARRVLDVLPKRFDKYGLRLHPEKTRLVRFPRPKGIGPRPETFDLLGFTHYWARSRKGRWVVKRKTSTSRFTRALARIRQWCRQHRHWPVRAQHAALVRKVLGHYAYYGITSNGRKLGCFVHEAERIWRRWLDSRSHRAKMTWDRFRRLLQRYPLPPPRVVHSIYRVAKPIV